MTIPDFVTVLIVAAPLGAIAWHDCRRFEIPPEAVAALLAAGILLHDRGVTAWSDGVAGAAFGAAVFLLPVITAAVLRRRPPLLPGDAGLLGSLGWVLGPLGLAWALAIGAPLALVHRCWLQVRRRRPVAAGYAPLGPGLCAGGLAVFLMMHAGIAMSDTPALASTQLGPDIAAGPPGSATATISLNHPQAVGFDDLAQRIAAASGYALIIEERPARSPGGAAVLDPAPPLRLDFEGRLVDLLDRIAVASGYRWTWRNREIVLYRYWDTEWQATTTTPASAPPDTWEVDRDRHDGLEEVLEAWATAAGWTLDWKAGHDYRLGADGPFHRRLSRSRGFAPRRSGNPQDAPGHRLRGQPPPRDRGGPLMDLRCLVLLALAMMSACAATDHGGPVADVEAEDPVVLRLVEAATRAERALLALAHDREGGKDACLPAPRGCPKSCCRRSLSTGSAPWSPWPPTWPNGPGYRFIESGPPTRQTTHGHDPRPRRDARPGAARRGPAGGRCRPSRGRRPGPGDPRRAATRRRRRRLMRPVVALLAILMGLRCRSRTSHTGGSGGLRSGRERYRLPP